MAHIRCDFKSASLKMNTCATVILPEEIPARDARVVYLLHGLEDNCTGWARYTAVELFARAYKLAIVIPEVQRSFYTGAYFTFVHEELREIAGKFFSLSSDRKKCYVMGLSMGGYGALKCALTTPQWYSGVAAFSSVVELEKSRDLMGGEFAHLFGDSIPPRDDLFALLSSATPSLLPRFFISCGLEDERLFHSRKIAAALEEAGACVREDYFTGGHDWYFWNEAARHAFDHFFKQEG